MDMPLISLPLWVLERLVVMADGQELCPGDGAAIAFAQTAIGPHKKDGPQWDADREAEITIRLRHAMFRAGYTLYGDRQAVLTGGRDDHYGPNDPARIALREVLSIPGERVASLIRYNSQQVIRRRVAEARLRVAYTALQKARDTFTEYGALHRAKDTVEASLKALRNDTLASEMDAAMTFDPDPSDYGRA